MYKMNTFSGHSMYIDDEAEMAEPIPICEPEVPWVDDDTNEEVIG